MPIPPRPPPTPPKYDANTVSALAGSSRNDDGSFVPSGGGLSQWLVEALDAAGTCVEVFHGSGSEVGGYPRMPLSAGAHLLVANATYEGGGVWKDGNNNEFRLERGEGNELSPVAA
ncbi:MAG: hypothetical protein AAF447_17315 [Myxococcota bacterium]